MMLILKDASYTHPNKEQLFQGINLTISHHDKIALIGNNGTGKSTLLGIIAGILQPSSGTIQADAQPYYVPQHFGQYNQLTIAQALHVADKLQALQQILSGQVTEENMTVLDDDWNIEERCTEALAHWELQDLSLTHSMSTLSGGQKTRVFLSGINIHQPQLVLLDEPSNHLDLAGRQLLYNFITATSAALLVVSHDRKLLNLLNSVCELNRSSITVYGGNYDFYVAQKSIEQNALALDVKNKEKELRKAKEVARETLERQQKLDARGKKKQEKAGVPTIAMNTLRNNAEKSTARAKEVHKEKTEAISARLDELRKELPDLDKMKLDFDNATLHNGKVLFSGKSINFGYGNEWLWPHPLDIEITSGERMAIKGTNGSGKTTLIKILLGQLQPRSGNIYRAENRSVYIDQEYSLINDQLTVYQQAQLFNATALQEHEIKIRLTWFLFSPEYWDKPCNTLSGGQKMRLILCCLTIGHQAPDIIILDEPTNNLDIQNVEILTAAVNDYKGTLIVISHDEYFLQQVGIEKMIDLD